MGKAEDLIKGRLREVGAVAVGITEATTVNQEEWERFEAWLDKGMEAGMGYMHNHLAIRRDPRLLLNGAKSLICCAFSYLPADASKIQPNGSVATYALLPDYHDWIRERVRAARLEELLGDEGTDWRICVDSAPILERYWAKRAGLGIIGRNGALIIPGVGCEVILCEIITTTRLEADSAADGTCDECGACSRACPTQANTDNGIDCNRCLSYLTIEHRGDWTDKQHLEAMSTPGGKHSLFGCDRCISACPMNNPEVTSSFTSNPVITNLSAKDILKISPAEFSKLFKGTPIKRGRLEGLCRNARNVIDFESKSDILKI